MVRIGFLKETAMRKTCVLFALLAVIVPLAALAATPAMPATPAMAAMATMAVPAQQLAPSSPQVMAQILTPQELAANAGTAVQVDAFLESASRGGTIVYPSSWVCSISCTACGGISGTCAQGSGHCVPNCP
jgi:hypothetical protein